MMDNRADTPHKKREIIERLVAVWEASPNLRLGQLIGNVYHSTDRGGVQLYYKEDYPLIAELEKYYTE